jgi:hypothetical protein
MASNSRLQAVGNPAQQSCTTTCTWRQLHCLQRTTSKAAAQTRWPHPLLQPAYQQAPQQCSKRTLPARHATAQHAALCEQYHTQVLCRALWVATIMLHTNAAFSSTPPQEYCHTLGGHVVQQQNTTMWPDCTSMGSTQVACSSTTQHRCLPAPTARHVCFTPHGQPAERSWAQCSRSQR